MKKVMIALALVLIIASVFAYKTFASKPVTHPAWITHPGRTDWQGCHHCWTNCARWGLDYGEYHCH